MPATAPPSTTRATTTATTAPKHGAATTGTFRLAVQPLDARTVEVAVTPPARLTTGRDYWFFVEVDWRNGNTDYYPREKLTRGPQTLIIAIPSDATLQADRAGRIYALTPDQSADAAERLERQQTRKDDDFFANTPGTTASHATPLPSGP
jgi:hypothetical protein